MLVLLGIAVVVAGFLLRFNPLLVVVVAALATGLLGAVAAVGWGHVTPQGLWAGLLSTIDTLGKGFNKSRYVSLVWLILPVIGLLEREGLQVRARQLMSQVRAATVGRLLIVYFLVRQFTAALGLTSICGHAQTVRPLIAPMAEGIAETRLGRLNDKALFRVRAWASATDNVAVFFGEDIFIAVASILVITGFLETSGYKVQPIELSLWALPSALAALLIHGVRLWRLDARLEKDMRAPGGAA